MSATNYPGIDYSRGQSNFDPETGIHFGVIPQYAVPQAWWDSSEPDYGEPELDEDGDEVELPDCAEPLGFSLDDGEYKAYCGEDGDIFIFKSPYYTQAQFCSPCAPGAGHLLNPCEHGPKTYCFPLDWFDAETECPYPIYRVSDNVRVYTPKTEEVA